MAFRPKLLLILWAGIVHGQEGSPQPTASEVAALARSDAQTATLQDATTGKGLFDGSVGEDSQVDVSVRPFRWKLQGEHLLGDWDGLRPRPEELGVTPTLTYVGDFAGNPSGGMSRGIAYADNLGLGLHFDLAKLAGINGGSFLISMSQRDGNSLSQERVGNVFTIQQVYGGETFHLINLAYQQKLLDDRVEFRIGRIAAGDDFLVSPEDYLFMQNGFDGNPVGIFFNSPGMTAYPNATWGTRLKVKPTDRTYVMCGIYNGDPSIREDDQHGVNPSLNGPMFAIAEVGYRRNGLPGDTQMLGNYKAGFWYDNSTFIDYKTVGYGRPPDVKRGSWGFYCLFDQILMPFAEATSDRGLGIFGSALFAPNESISQMPFFFTTGVSCRGIFASRPTDSAGFAVVYGRFSSDLSQAEERESQTVLSTGVQDYETALELTYRFHFRESAVFFQPDLQYLVRPGGTGKIGNAFVLGCQIGVNF